MRNLRAGVCSALAIVAVISCTSKQNSPPDSGTPIDSGTVSPPDSGTPVDAGTVVPAPTLACSWPTGAMVGQGPLTVSIYGSAMRPGVVGTWNGSARPTTFVDAGFALVELTPDDLAGIGQGALALVNPSQTEAPDASIAFPVTQPAARRRVASVGVWTEIERRGWAAGYWPGELLQQWSTFDSVVGSTPAEEAQLQLATMASLGINTITYPISAADGGQEPFTPPDCVINSVAGPQYPQPTPEELTNLRAFLDEAQDAGIKVWLRTTNNHMEEWPPTNNARWLGAVLGAVRGHPALDAITFDGTQHINGGTCGIPAEPPLWEGPSSPSARYVTWAIGFAMDAGFPARQLTAEEVVGSYQLLNTQNLTPTVQVMKGIFDQLGIPPAERTYALSMYEETRCQSSGGLPCVDEPREVWMTETMAQTWDVIGRCSGARVIVPEMGTMTPLDGGWRGEWSVEHLGTLFEQYGVQGGGYWLWVQTDTSSDSNPTLAPAVKYRGTAFTYSPVKNELVDLGGQHLSVIPNGSFERGDGGVDSWTVVGANGGAGSRYLLTQEPGQPEVITRGVSALRLSSGSDPAGAARADSAWLPVLGGASYVLTGQLRFAFSGDPNPSAPSAQRPQVWISLKYATADGGTATRAQEDFRFFQEDSAADFKTVPIVFTTPDDAARVQVELGVQRAGLPSPITADFDDLR